MNSSLRCFIEPLEARIAPAVLVVNATTATYTDVDGDKVTIKTTIGDLNTAGFTSEARGLGEQLQLIDFHNGGFDKTNLTITVKKVPGGDGLANIGAIDSTNHDLGSVIIPGDLGQIDAGDPTWTTPGMKSLTVRSLGQFKLGTQAPGGALESVILGSLGALTVKGDIVGANIYVSGADDGDLGPVRIGGSIIGDSRANSGQIQSTSTMGPVTVGGDIVGGSNFATGAIYAGEKVTSVTVRGSVFGGTSDSAGAIIAGSAGAITIGGDLLGGAGQFSGVVNGGTFASVKIGGSLIGGAGIQSGGVFSLGNLGAVTISGIMLGGTGNESGKIDSGGKVTSVTIGGSLLGGSGLYNTITDANMVVHFGQIFSVGEMGPVKIGGDVLAGSGAFSGTINGFAKLGNVTIAGSLVGGSVRSGGEVGAVAIGGDVKDALILSGGVFGGDLASVTIGDSMIGGAISSNNHLGPVKIGRDVSGGAITAEDSLTSVNIGGSLVGGPSSGTGLINADDIGSVRIGGDLLGGSIPGGSVSLFLSGAILSAHRIASVTIGGSIIAGSDNSIAGDLIQNATIRVGDDIGVLSIGGDVLGNESGNGITQAIISTRGRAVQTATTDLAIGALTIGGRVELAQIFAGYDKALLAKNADAQIGAVNIGGDWINSSLVVGVINLGADDSAGGGHADSDNLNFGDIHDFKITGGTDTAGIFSRVASITIGGRVFGATGNFGGEATRSGFVAENIAALKIGGVAVTLQAGRNNDGLFLPSTTGATLHELGSAFVVSTPGAGASLVNASTVTFTDVDGDKVTVKLSQPLLNAGNVNNVFFFDNGSVGSGPARQQLQVLDLSALATNGLNVTVTVAPGGGDRLANIGNIHATGYDVGTVVIPGDLGQIDAGSGAVGAVGLKSLTVRSLGRLGTDSQPAMSVTFPPGLESAIAGRLAALNVQHDIAGASFLVDGSINTVNIGGSLLGGITVDSGLISTTEEIGRVTIGGDIVGGSQTSAGRIDADGIIEAVTVGGSIIGRAGAASGRVGGTGSVGAVKVGGDVIGGTGELSGAISTTGALTSASLGGSLRGSVGPNGSGQIVSTGPMGTVTIDGDIFGGGGEGAGFIRSSTSLGAVTLGGSLVGGTGPGSGLIQSTGGMLAVKIGGNVLEGGIQSTGMIAGVRAGGSLLGGNQDASGAIFATLDLGPVTIGRNVIGGAGLASGQIQSNQILGTVSIGGALVGGEDDATGSIVGQQGIGAVTIGRDVVGGAGGSTGYLSSSGKLASLKIGGSLLAGRGDFSGVVTVDDLGPVTIGGNLVGGSITGTTADLDATGAILSSRRIGNVTIDGSIVAGIDTSTAGLLLHNATIRAGDDIGALVVKGSLLGRPESLGFTSVIIAASGQPVPPTAPALDFAIKSVTVGHRVQFSKIFGGVNSTFATDNPNAAIGPVKVGGAWVASDLSTSGRITSIAIAGIVAGNSTTGLDFFVFSGRQIGSFKSLGYTAPLTAAPNQTFDLSPTTQDVQIFETP